MKIACTLLLGMLCLAGPADAHAADAGAPADAEALGQWLQRRQLDSGVVGVAAAVVVDGEVAWSGAFGDADRQAGIAMTPGKAFAAQTGPSNLPVAARPSADA